MQRLAARDEPRRRQREPRIGRLRQKRFASRSLANVVDLHQLDANRLVRAGLHAGRGFAVVQPLAAHVALADDALGRVVLGHVVGAHQRAVLAADALIVEVPHDAGDRVFVVGQRRAAVQARRLQAVMAGGRDVLQDVQPAAVAAHQAHRRRETSRSSSRPFRLWQAVTHALQPEQASRSTEKAYCSPGCGAVSGIRSR